MSTLLEVKNLNASYGSGNVLFDVSFDVRIGEVVVLLGRNGAGKTTTLKSIMGVHPPKSGSVRVRGEDIAGLASHKICARGLGFVPEDRRIFKGLSVQENLETGRRPPRSGPPRWDEAQVLGLFPALREMLHRQADSLSGGEQQMLAVARTLMGNPDLLLLDEPSEGLAPLIVEQLRKQLYALKEAGATILMSEQNLGFSLRLADRVYIIEKGEIKYEGLPRDLIADEAVRKAYLMV